MSWLRAGLIFGWIMLEMVEQGKATTFALSPFEELSLCLPFDVEISLPSDSNAAYSVSISGDQAVIATITARQASASTSFQNLSPGIQGVLFLYAVMGSIPSSLTPVQIKIYIPQLKLRVVDVTRGTFVMFPRGFLMSPLSGMWNVPAGAKLYAPQVAIPGKLKLQTAAPAEPYSDGGWLVWTNLRSNEHLQAISLLGPASIVVNSTSEGIGFQNFEIQPDPAHPLAGTFANISVKADASSIALYEKASERDVYVFNTPCEVSQCPARYFICSFNSGCLALSPTQSQSYNISQTIPKVITGNAVPFKACPLGVASYTCEAGATSQFC